MTDYINDLGYKAKDKVTGISGTITSVSFDLYGCIQYLLTPVAEDQTGKHPESLFFDRDRLIIDRKHKKVMEVPKFDKVKENQDRLGPAKKPTSNGRMI